MIALLEAVLEPNQLVGTYRSEYERYGEFLHQFALELDLRISLSLHEAVMVAWFAMFRNSTTPERGSRSQY